MQLSSRLMVALIATAALAGCSSSGELVVEDGVGITAIRSACPAVGVPDYTGDVTLFRTPGSTDASQIDVAATLTDLRATCDDAAKGKARSASAGDETHVEALASHGFLSHIGIRRHGPVGKPAGDAVPGSMGQVHSDVTFTVSARRLDTRGDRDVTLPYFVSVVRGGTSVVSKRVGSVTLHFADGQARAEARASAGAAIDKAEATLAADVRERITRKRTAGEADAALDPLADPDVRGAVDRATFEVLVGFQLDQSQLAYNVTR